MYAHQKLYTSDLVGTYGAALQRMGTLRGNIVGRAMRGTVGAIGDPKSVLEAFRAKGWR